MDAAGVVEGMGTYGHNGKAARANCFKLRCVGTTTIRQQCRIQVRQQQCRGLNHQRILEGVNGRAPFALSLVCLSPF